MLKIDKEKKEKLRKMKQANVSSFIPKICDKSGAPWFRGLTLKDRMEMIDDGQSWQMPWDRIRIGRQLWRSIRIS